MRSSSMEVLMSAKHLDAKYAPRPATSLQAVLSSRLTEFKALSFPPVALGRRQARVPSLKPMTEKFGACARG